MLLVASPSALEPPPLHSRKSRGREHRCIPEPGFADFAKNSKTGPKTAQISTAFMQFERGPRKGKKNATLKQNKSKRPRRDLKSDAFKNLQKEAGRVQHPVALSQGG